MGEPLKQEKAEDWNAVAKEMGLFRSHAAIAKRIIEDGDVRFILMTFAINHKLVKQIIDLKKQVRE